jgi:hypothetical protein
MKFVADFNKGRSLAPYSLKFLIFLETMVLIQMTLFNKLNLSSHLSNVLSMMTANFQTVGMILLRQEILSLPLLSSLKNENSQIQDFI